MIQPGSTTDFIESVLPILRARGVFRGEYTEGESLRERLTGASDRALPASHPAAQFRH
jgi:long-chain alkane monooxygenase